MSEDRTHAMIHNVKSMEIEKKVDKLSSGEGYLTIRISVITNNGAAYEQSFFADIDSKIELKGFENESKDG